jgi:hypothetical protein
MSIVNVLKNPPIWSPAYNPIIWMVDSDQTTQFKFRYVFDVYIYEQASYIRFKVPPNPKGAGLIDVSTLVAGELSIPDNTPFLSTTPFYLGDFLSTTVYCKVGEEYATTIDGEPILYNGLGGTGAPAYALYADGNWRPAPNSTTPVVAWASGQGANESYDYYSTGGENILAYEMDLPSPSPVEGKFLTRCPNNPQTIRSDEDFTLTWLNWNFETEQLYGEVPYTMRATYYDGTTSLGYQDFYNTPAEGGTGWATCSTWGGVTGDNYWLQSFKINPSDSLTSIRDQDDLFPNWGASGGSTYQPFPQIFTGFGFDSGLVPPVAFTTQIYDDQYIETTNCLEPPGVTGWSDLYYQPMDVPTGSVIDFVLLTGNAFGNSYPEMYLWGTTGDPSVPTGWVSLVVFTETNSSGNILYTVNNYTTTQNYTALGLRFYAANIADECGFYGPFSTPDSYVTIESSVTGLFDKFCLDLHKYSDYATCAVDPVPISETICLEINDDNCWGFQPIRFTWMNNLGGRDWFTFMKRNTQVQNANRTTMFRVPGYWSAGTFSVQQVNPSRWGTTVFNVDLTNTWTASTDWITEEESEWLRSMFASPSVFAYLPGRTEPTAITITDANYSVESYARQKLFQYFVSFVEAQPDVVQAY